MTALYVIASIVGYLAVGWAIGARATPAVAAKAIRDTSGRWPTLAEDENFLSRQAREAATITIWTCLLFWPVALPVALVQSRISRVVDAADPIAQQQRIREQETRIKELERELGIGGPQ